MLVAGTHGRGAFRLNDPSPAVPALVVSKVDAGVPVGPSSNVDYTLTLKNIGNADATGVTIKDPLPANTSFVSADEGGTVPERRRHLDEPDRPEGRLGGDSRRAGSHPGALHRQHRQRAAEQGEEHRQRWHHRHLDAGPRHDRVAVHHANRTALLGRARSGDADRRRPASARTSTTRSRCRTSGSTPTRTRMSSTGGTWTTSFLDATCTTPLASNTTAERAVRVIDPGLREGGDSRECGRQRHEHRHGGRDLDRRPVRAGSGSVKTIAVAVPTLLVDNDTNAPHRFQDADRAGAHLGRHGASGLGSQRRREAAAELPAGVRQRRLVHRQQLPGADPAL